MRVLTGRIPRRDYIPPLLPGVVGEAGLKALFLNDSTSGANWGDRAAAFSLKAMVVEAGATSSGIITEDELGQTRFGGPPQARSSSKARQRAMLRSLIPPVVLAARRRVFADVDLTPDNRIIPARWEDF